MFALERPHVMARGVHLRVEIDRGKVCQEVHFEIAPDVFDGIEFGCVGREEMRMQARVALKKLACDLGAMGPGSCCRSTRRKSMTPPAWMLVLG